MARLQHAVVPAGGNKAGRNKAGRNKAGGVKRGAGVGGVDASQNQTMAAPSDESRGLHAGTSQLQHALLQALHEALLRHCFSAVDPPCAALEDAVTDTVAAEAAEAYQKRLQKGLSAVRSTIMPPTSALPHSHPTCSRPYGLKPCCLTCSSRPHRLKPCLPSMLLCDVYQ